MKKSNEIPQMRSTSSKRDKNPVAYVCINSRKHHLGPLGSAKAQEKYKRLIAEWLATGRSPTFGLPEKQISMSQLFSDYLKFCETYYGTGKNSEVHRVARVMRTVCELYGSYPAVDFGVLQFKAVQQQFILDGLARSYINASMNRVVRTFKWLAGEGRLSPIIPQTLAIVPSLKRGRTTAHETDRILPVDDATVDATLPHLTNVVADMVRFHRWTGCRPAEVCSIRPFDINRSGETWEYRPVKHKTQYLGRERVVFIGPKAQEVLRPYLLRAGEAFCFSPAESERQRRAEVHANRKTTLSCGNRPGTNRKRRRDIVRVFGDQYDPRSYRRAIWYGCKKAGIAPWAPNRLRHAAATEIRRRFGLEAAQVILGHSQANITQIYAERDFALAARVASQVG